MRQFAVIVAGGTGTRMGGGIPKQFRSLCGRPMLWWSMKAFYDENPSTEIILVLPEEFIILWEDFFSSLPEKDRLPHVVTAGGQTRTESVKRGLILVPEDSLVAIHDGARPLLKKDLISRGWQTASENGAAIPVVPAVDSMREIRGDSSKAVDRSLYRCVQTPQVFISRLLKKSYQEQEGRTFTDDASVVEATGHKITLYEGDPSNLKVTTPIDMTIASCLLGDNA